MSVISFSGLATGLDTNSWVSALTALKNAKVEELQAERAAVVNVRDVVDGIKSYFTSFKSSLERLTDAKFKVDALDIFVQNLANSSDPSKVTATATSSASRDTYEVGVTQLATATKVNTAIRETYTATYTASDDTKLSILGVKEGYVSLNNKEIQIENSDTLGTLVEKLEGIGIDADYDETLGRLTFKTDIFESDQGVTELFTALGLEFKTVSGLKSAELKMEGYVTIKPDTLLADIGVNGGDIMINQTLENIAFGADATVQDALDWFNNKYGAGTASMDAEGIITITGIDAIEVTGGSNVLTGLGLSGVVDGVASSSPELSHVQTETAEWGTELGKLNTTFANYNLVLGNGTTTATINLSANSTLQDVKDQITAYATANGMNATVELDEDGALVISGDIDNLYVSGGVATGLGLEYTSVFGTTMTGSALPDYVLTKTATASTTFDDLGISGANLNYKILNDRQEEVFASAVTGGMTLENWFDSMKQYGITATLSDTGVISIEGGVISGNLATALGLGSVVSGSEISETTATSTALSGVVTVTATLTTTLGDLNITSNPSLTIRQGANETTINFTNASTIKDVLDAVNSNGGTATFENNVLKISGVDNITGTALTAFGLAATGTGDATSLTATGITYTTGSIATESSKFSDYGITPASYNVYASNGDLIASNVALSADATISDMIAQLASYGLEGYVDSSGCINISGGYITGTMATNLGISTSAYKTQVTSVTQVSKQFSVQVATVATLGTTLSQVNLSGGSITIKHDEDAAKTFNFSGSSTFADIQDAVLSAGGEFSMQDGIFSISGVKVTGATSGIGIAHSLGSDTTYTTTSTTVITTTVNTIPTVIQQTLVTVTTTHTTTDTYAYSSNTRTYNITTTDIDPGSTQLSSMGISGNVTVTNAGTNATFGTSGKTVNDLLAWLTTNGVETSFENGRFVMSADSDIQVSNDSMGISSNVVRETLTRNTTSSVLNNTQVHTVTAATTLGAFTDNASERTLEMVINGETVSKAFAATDTVQTVIDFLAAQGITASMTSGTFKASSTYQEFSVGGELGFFLLGNNPSITTSSRNTEWTGRINDYEKAATIDENTKIETLGVTLGSIKIYDNGTWINSAITLDENSTIGDFLNALAGYGFDATLAGGKITITADSDKYIANETSDFVTKFGLTNRTQTSVNLYDQTNSAELIMTSTHPIEGSTTLKDLGFDSGASLRLEINGVMQTLGFTADETVQDVLDSISTWGIDVELDGNVLKASSETQTFKMLGTLAEKLCGTAPTYVTTEKVLGYQGAEQNSDNTYVADETTKLTDLGISTGYFNVFKDDQMFSTIAIREDTTVGQLFSALAAFGITSNIDANGVLSIESIGNITLKDGTSDLVSVLGLTDNIKKCTYTGTTMVLEDNANNSSLDTLLSYYDTVDKFAEGSIYFDLTDQDGNVTQAVVNLEDTDTIGDLIRKLEEVGISASFENNKISYHYGLGTATITGGSSSFVDTMGFAAADLEQWMQSVDTIDYDQEEIRYLSVCNYADNSTTLETLGVTDGEFAIGVNGSLKAVSVNATDTLGNVIAKISTATGGAVTAEITADGRFVMKAADGVELIVSTSTDTTNLATIFNLVQDGSNVVEGKTSLYKASSNSKLTQGGVFRNGNVTTGTFSIGNATFTITGDTTIASLISDINHSEEANANAYWDNINGKMIITSSSLGASYVNIAAGSSNFTEVFGLTVNDGGVEKLTTYNQKLGDNAILTINDTRIVATSNTITSDISRIEGLTVNIKNVTPGEYVTITVERDTQSIIDAVQETLDSYNALVAEVNSTLAIGGELHNDIALKQLKNQISLLMTSGSNIAGNQFRNLSAIGISTENASSAMTSDIYSLYLNADKLENSLNISEEDVKELLVGTEANPGVLTKVENIIEQMLSTTGYFASTTKSLNRQIANWDKKIERAQSRADQYKAILERKFQSMEQLYSNMQTSYKGLFAG